MTNKNIKFKKYRIPLISSALGISGVFLLSFLTFIPSQTFAESLIVDENEKRSLSQIDTMQEMSQQICINSRENETKQLEDIREPGKKYWVAKLKDGNCWMTQNLDFDVPAELSEASSDVVGENVSTGIISATSISAWTSNSASANYYADPGDFVYSYPGHEQAAYGICNEVTALDNKKCEGYFSEVDQDSDMHYHIGNFYTYSAATVRTGDNLTMTSGHAPHSICPAGWKLPISGWNAASSSPITNSGSFGGLLSAYSWTSDDTMSSAIGPNGIYNEPLYFIYGGFLLGGSLNHGGYIGNYWSASPYILGSSYLLNFTDSVQPAYSDVRYRGRSIRCLAEGGAFTDPLLADNQANVAITVSPVISIDVTKDANDMTVDFTKVATSTIIARVGSNQPYQVLLSTDESNLTNPNADRTIPMIPSDQTIVKGTNSWGVKKLSSPTDTEVNENTTYSPVGINGDKALFYTSTSAASEDLTFPVAIAVDSSLPSGQYSTQVTLTAVAI